MYSALYYPHTKIRSESILKTALLLWDEIHTIVPWDTYSLEAGPPEESEAFDLIGQKLCPSTAEKEQVHSLVEDFVSRPLPTAFFLDDGCDVSDTYEMFRHKLLGNTWKLLREAGLARPTYGRAGHYTAARPTGLALMGLLADCCAGSTLTRVTDRESAYAGLAGLFIDQPEESQDPVSRLFPEARAASTHKVLLPIALEAIDANQFSLPMLIKFRKLEQQESGYRLKTLRHNLTDHLSEQARALSAAESERDIRELKRLFGDSIRLQYSELKDALKLKSSEVLTSKEVVACVAVAGTVFAASFPTALSSTLDLGAVTLLVCGLVSKASQFVECPATFVPVEMRQTGMRGTGYGTREEAYGGADRESAATG
jgi:hypothetical protein